MPIVAAVRRVRTRTRSNVETRGWRLAKLAHTAAMHMDCIGVCSETATTQAELNPKSVRFAQTSTSSLAAEAAMEDEKKKTFRSHESIFRIRMRYYAVRFRKLNHTINSQV